MDVVEPQGSVQTLFSALDSSPPVTTKVDVDDGIWLLENFLSPTECESLISLSEQIGYEDSKLFARHYQNARNNDRAMVSTPRVAS